jgi:two-component system, NtrC family, sensor kinase
MKRETSLLPHTRAVRITAVLAAAVLLLAFLPGALGASRQSLVNLMLAAMLGFMAYTAWGAIQRSVGTRRVVLWGVFGAALAGAVGEGIAALVPLLTGNSLPFPAANDAFYLIAHSSLLLGFLWALRRVRPVRFSAAVDALLLVAAAIILIVQLDYFSGSENALPAATMFFVLVWQAVAAITLILLAMLLAWRGERLGAPTATGLTLGTVTLAMGSAWYMRLEVSGAQAGMDGPIVLLALAVTGYLLLLGAPTEVPAAMTAERPRVESDAATIRAVAIVVAILIASGSAAALGFVEAPSRGLALTIAGFGVLLSVRTAYALWEQRQTTIALENSIVAEREMSATLEQRVAERTRELAEAQRAVQRMWTLAQQIALELDRGRVQDRFCEAITDVARADGAVVAVHIDDRLQVVAASGIAQPMLGAALSAESALGRVQCSGEPWWSENAHHDGLGGAVPEAALAPDIRGMATVPLQRRGERIGAVGIVSARHRRFTDPEIAHVEAMTELLSLALANVALVETMRQTEWRFRTLFRVAPDAVLTVLESGRIREANETVREITGLEPLQVVGRQIEDFIVPGDRERVRFELAETLAGTPARLEVHFLHPSGNRIVSLAARRLPQADPPTVLVVGRDMTSEREMRTRLAETERLAAVGELVAGVAHEVNNPLCTISAFAQLMLKDQALSDEQRDSVEVIRSETVRASHVLRDLLTFARRSEGSRQPVDLNEVVQRTLRLRAFELEKEGIRLDTVLESTLPPVLGDSGQLQQVVLNLITNALQAMRGRGGGTLRLATRADYDRVTLEVGDSGPGISTEVRARIFEPFFTTKKEGTGLGLSVSYGIVAAHGGSIAVAGSSPGGTVFHVTLRATRAESAVEDPVAGLIIADSSPLSGRRLLFVDDEPSLRTGMATFGKLRRINVVTAEDGASALAAARIGDFDAVICDLRMPGMDGASFWEALRAERPALASRTVFITGDVVSPGSRTFLDATRQPVLTKPFDFEQLEQTVESLLRAEVAALDA